LRVDYVLNLFTADKLLFGVILGRRGVKGLRCFDCERAAHAHFLRVYLRLVISRLGRQRFVIGQGLQCDVGNCLVDKALSDIAAAFVVKFVVRINSRR
jgi:hypothetical protein